MDKQLLLRWAPWAIVLVAAFYTVTGLRAQIATQQELNVAMQGMKNNVAKARELTGETAAALAPLASTADTLAAMNAGLKLTVADLEVMNETMARVLVKQEGIAGRVGSLNGNMGKVVTTLSTVDASNKALLNANAALTAQTNNQANAVTRLSALTSEAIGHLNHLNRKFGFLSQF